MIKVFISHQAADSTIAERISRRLKEIHSISSYLDIIDPGIKYGDDLSAHIQTEMGKCTQLLAVVSDNTRQSWWVPWEIGVATEKYYPLATFLSNVTSTPEYLRKWPHLYTDRDLDYYADASKYADRSLKTRRETLSEDVARRRSTNEFFNTLRNRLGQ